MSPLMEALAHDHRQRLLAEAASTRRGRARRRPGPARRAVGATLIRVGNRLARPHPVLLSPGR